MSSTARDYPLQHRVDLAALREKHDPVARSLVTLWRAELFALIEVVEAAYAFLGGSDNETAAHARLNAALDRIDFGDMYAGRPKS